MSIGTLIREFYSQLPRREIVGVVEDVHDDSAHRGRRLEALMTPDSDYDQRR